MRPLPLPSPAPIPAREEGGARSRIAAAALLAALLVLFPPPPSLHAAPVAKLRELVRPGELAPAFTLLSLDGRKTAYRPGEGGASLLVFWSAFCPLCRELALPIEGLSRRSGGTVALWWINLDGARFRNAVRSFAKEVPIDGPVLLDEIRDDLFVACDPYGIEKTPTAVVVGADGKVHRVYVAEEIRALLRDFEKEVAALRCATGGGALPGKKPPKKSRKGR